MGKRLKFLYRYFTTSYRWRRWINLQMVILLAASALFFAALFLTAPRAAKSQQPQPEATVTAALPLTPSPDLQVTPTVTPYPPEFLTNTNQTIGITFVATVLILIVLFGTVFFLPKKSDSK